MKKHLFILTWALVAVLGGCKSAKLQLKKGPSVEAGIDVLEGDGFKELSGKKIGLITNMSARDLMGRPVVSVLAAVPGVNLVRVFSTEHGLWALSEAPAISSGAIVLGGRSIPIVSLYGGGLESMRPKPDDLAGLDALVVDLPDIGTRFYTYLTTMGLALEATAKLKIEFIVLDRPNPITGSIVEGPLLDAATLAKLNPTAYSPVSIRHGLTEGEMALLDNNKIGNKKLTIVKVSGWRRRMWFDETGLLWFPPSPNIPDLDAAALYPGLGIFEASNISVGRGTPWPFGWIGAPWMDSKKIISELAARSVTGVEFSPLDARPEKSVFSGKLCHGIRIKILNRNRLRADALFLALNDALMRLYPKDFIWSWDQAQLMVGTGEFHHLIETHASLKTQQAFFNRQAALFKKERKAYLLYR